MLKMLLWNRWSGGCCRWLMMVLLVYGGSRVWAATDLVTGRDTPSAAPAVDIGKLEKPEPRELTTAEIARSATATNSESNRKLPVVALLDFETSTLNVGEVKAISQAIWARLRKRGDLAMLPREATRRWLISVDLHPFTPYRTELNLQPVVTALNADYLVFGFADKVSSTYLIDYSIYSARLGKLVMQDAQMRRMDLDRLVSEVGVMAQEMGDGIKIASDTPVGVDSTSKSTIATPEEAVATVAIQESVDQKKPEKVAKVRIRKATLVESPTNEMPETPADKAKVIDLTPAMKTTPEATSIQDKTETQSPADTQVVTQATQTIEAPATDAEKASTESVKTTTDTQTQSENVETTATEAVPKVTPEVVNPVRAAFDKAMKLPRGSEERLAMLQDVVAKDPKTLVYHRLLIDELFRQGQYAHCIEVCDQALVIKPDDSLLLTVQGAAHFEQNQLTEARAAYEKAIAADSSNWYAHYNLAQTLTVMKSPKAPDAWRSYLTVAGDDPAQTSYVEEARHNLADLED